MGRKATASLPFDRGPMGRLDRRQRRRLASISPLGLPRAGAIPFRISPSAHYETVNLRLTRRPAGVLRMSAAGPAGEPAGWGFPAGSRALRGRKSQRRHLSASRPGKRRAHHPVDLGAQVGSGHGCLRKPHRGGRLAVLPAHLVLPTTIAVGRFYTEQRASPFGKGQTALGNRRPGGPTVVM